MSTHRERRSSGHTRDSSATRRALRATARGPAPRLLAPAAVAILLLGSCGSGGGGGSVGPNGDAELVAVHYGRLADVYALRQSASGEILERVAADVLLGVDIQARSPDGADRPHVAGVDYEFLRPDPATLTSRLLLRARIGSPELDRAFAALDRRARRVAPGFVGQDTDRFPHAVVPRNAALRLTFSRPLGIDLDFFVERDADGVIQGVKNTEAVQLLHIVGDPDDADPVGDFEAVPARIVPRGRELILDPVLLGDEGARYRTSNNASGLPESANQRAANMRIAVALEGPLRIRGVREDDSPNFTGVNHNRERSVIRDFRSGSRDDASADMQNGFIRDAEPPRLLGEVVTYLAAVRRVDAALSAITVFKDGVAHEIDAGDGVRVVDASGQEIGTSEVAVDPVGDRGRPRVQTVAVTIRHIEGLEAHDPRRRADHPDDPDEVPRWLVANAPRVIVESEFTMRRIDPDSGAVVEDDPALFVRFQPGPLPSSDDAARAAPNENVSPFAGAVVRFSKPVAVESLRALETLFIATRDVLTPSAIDAFRAERGISDAQFRHAKFVTPHLIASRLSDLDGSQTRFRLLPLLGLYLDATMREVDGGKSLRDLQFPYYLHVVAGGAGIRDLSGNPLDFDDRVDSEERLVVPFGLDLRTRPDGRPLFDDNLVVYVARRFVEPDEDGRPSYYRADEVREDPPHPFTRNAADLFGAARPIDGHLQARSTTRLTRWVDDRNQTQPVSQSRPTRWCPTEVIVEFFGADESVVTPTGQFRFNQGVQNPLNPFGSRLQSVWRELDMSLSRLDPEDYDLDVEAMSWGAFGDSNRRVVFDQFDRISLFLGHSELRPEPCVGSESALPTLPASGLGFRFAENYLNNRSVDGAIESQPAPHPAFVGQSFTINAGLLSSDPSGINRYLPMPAFQRPYFVWRDERVVEQGGNTNQSNDVVRIGRRGDYDPYLISPFLGGRGSAFTGDASGLTENLTTWNNLRNMRLPVGNLIETSSGGGVGAVMLPLLADFQVLPDDSELPVGNPFRAVGLNGWQISLAVTSNPAPNFRVVSGGFFGGARGQPILVDPSAPDWEVALGGYDLQGNRTARGDNSVYWVRADFLKRLSLATSGFVDLYDPHRVPDAASPDPRLGPFFLDANGEPTVPRDVLPRFAWSSEPPLAAFSSLGASVTAEFRGAGPVDPMPWRATVEDWEPADRDNFPLDPRKAGDAQIRKLDTRDDGGVARDHWTYPYNRNVTDYTDDPNRLTDDRFVRRFAGPRDRFGAREVRYVNWRLVFENNVDVEPPVEPAVDSFALAYRFERTPR